MAQVVHLQELLDSLKSNDEPFRIESGKPKADIRATKDSTGVWWWSKKKAQELGASQLALSACGPTAVLNVLRILGYKTVKAQDILNVVPARLRDYEAPLAGYLLSRAKAGTTHLDLIRATERLTGGEVTGTFFALHPLTPPERLAQWLGVWMRAGAVPMLTTNLFLEGQDAWHHQVVHGIEKQEGSPGGLLCLLNPLASETAERVIKGVTGPPFMIIPRDHIERKLFDLLSAVPDDQGAAVRALTQAVTPLEASPPWSTYDVGQQVKAVFVDLVAGPGGGEQQAGPPSPLGPSQSAASLGSPSGQRATAQRSEYAWGSSSPSRFDGVVIPWGGLGGVTLFVHRDSLAQAWLALKTCMQVELPLYGTVADVCTDLSPLSDFAAALRALSPTRSLSPTKGQGQGQGQGLAAERSAASSLGATGSSGSSIGRALAV